MILFFRTNIPLGLFFNFCLTRSQSPIGQIPNLPSHQELAQELKQGLATSHKNITFIICDCVLHNALGFSCHDGGDKKGDSLFLMLPRRRQ